MLMCCPCCLRRRYCETFACSISTSGSSACSPSDEDLLVRDPLLEGFPNRPLRQRLAVESPIGISLARSCPLMGRPLALRTSLVSQPAGQTRMLSAGAWQVVASRHCGRTTVAVMHLVRNSVMEIAPPVTPGLRGCQGGFFPVRSRTCSLSVVAHSLDMVVVDSARHGRGKQVRL